MYFDFSGLSFINKTLSFAIGGNPLPLGGGRSPCKSLIVNPDSQYIFVW